MKIDKKILYMYSFHNMIASYVAFIYKKTPEVVLDTLRASNIYVIGMVLYYYLRFGFKSGQRFFRKNLGLPNLTLLEAYIIDFIVHVLPLLLLGFPKNCISFVYAFIIIATWYVLIRNSIENIYGTAISKDHADMLIILLFILNLSIFLYEKYNISI